jgi:hypothetical protein
MGAMPAKPRPEPRPYSQEVAEVAEAEGGAGAGTVHFMSHMYDLTMTSIGGDAVALDRFRDQVCLIVNVASY